MTNLWVNRISILPPLGTSDIPLASHTELMYVLECSHPMLTLAAFKAKWNFKSRYKEQKPLVEKETCQTFTSSSDFLPPPPDVRPTLWENWELTWHHLKGLWRDSITNVSHIEKYRWERLSRYYFTAGKPHKITPQSIRSMLADVSRSVSSWPRVCSLQRGAAQVWPCWLCSVSKALNLQRVNVLMCLHLTSMAPDELKKWGIFCRGSRFGLPNLWVETRMLARRCDTSDPFVPVFTQCAQVLIPPTANVISCQASMKFYFIQKYITPPSFLLMSTLLLIEHHLIKHGIVIVR